MANAATIAGLAFSNAFVGVNHALAHAFGARFGVAHGRANGALPPPRAALQRRAAAQVHARARLRRLRRPAEVRAGRHGCSASAAHGEAAARERLFARVDELLAAVGMPRTVAEAGIDPDAYRAAIPDLVRDAFRDPSLRTNPRMPLIAELAELFLAVCPAR